MAVLRRWIWGAALAAGLFAGPRGAQAGMVIVSHSAPCAPGEPERAQNRPTLDRQETAAPVADADAPATGLTPGLLPGSSADGGRDAVFTALFDGLVLGEQRFDFSTPPPPTPAASAIPLPPAAGPGAVALAACFATATLWSRRLAPRSLSRYSGRGR